MSTPLSPGTIFRLKLSIRIAGACAELLGWVLLLTALFFFVVSIFDNQALLQDRLINSSVWLAIVGVGIACTILGRRVFALRNPETRKSINKLMALSAFGVVIAYFIKSSAGLTVGAPIILLAMLGYANYAWNKIAIIPAETNRSKT